MSEPIRVKMAEYSVGKSPDILITIGLGSCIGVALYDSTTKIGGLVHIMLPENRKGLKPAKFADTGIPYLVDKMIEAGASRRNIVAKIAGGARMFASAGDLNIQVGQRNIEAVSRVLEEMNIKVVASDVGEDYGRTMEFYTENGKVLIRSYKKGKKFL
jgi:chemotaxis protein CheD